MEKNIDTLLSLVDKIKNLDDGEYRNLRETLSCDSGYGLIMANQPICICSGGNAHA